MKSDEIICKNANSLLFFIKWPLIIGETIKKLSREQSEGIFRIFLIVGNLKQPNIIL